MIKKIICLALGLLMVLSLLTSCGKDEDTIGSIIDDASRSTTSLNMWVITESPLVSAASEKLANGWNPDDLSDEQQAEFDSWSMEEREALTQVHAIGKAINKITKQKFKTQLTVKYVTEDAYYEKVEKAFADHKIAIEEAKAAAKAEREEMKNNGILNDNEEEEKVENEVILNEHGIPELKYPEAAAHQVDILFVGNYEKYREYADNGWLVTLDDKLENDAMQLSYYVNQIYLDAATYNGATYAVPNNRPIGEYTYLCVKTSEMEQYGLNVSDFSSLSIYDNTFYEFLTKVLNASATTGVMPLYTESGKVDMDMIHYWDYDLDKVTGDCILNDGAEFSLFGSVYSNLTETGSLTSRGDLLSYGNLLSNPVFMEQYFARKLEYEEKYVTNDPTKATAACVVKGGWELREEYEEAGYQVLLMANPRATNDAVYDSMFGLGVYTADEGRAMEIINYLNTNKEFRKLLQHGIENMNYTLTPVTIEQNDGTEKEFYYATETANNVYKMDMNKTGNVFLAYPTSEQGIHEWEYGKHQNLDASMYPTLGLFFDLDTFKIDEKSIAIVQAVSGRVNTYIKNNLTTSQAVLSFYRNQVGTNPGVSVMANLLLGITGNDMSYTLHGESKTFTRDELIAALNCMANNKLVEEKDALQSPNALYRNWITTVKS